MKILHKINSGIAPIPHQKSQFLCPHKAFFFAPGTVPEEAPRNIFFSVTVLVLRCKSVFLHIFKAHKLQIILLVNLTKRKKHMFVNLTKLESFMFRPHKGAAICHCAEIIF